MLKSFFFQNRKAKILFLLILVMLIVIVLTNLYRPIKVDIIGISYYFQDIYEISENKNTKTLLINGEYVIDSKWQHLINKRVPILYLDLKFNNSSLIKFSDYNIKIVSNDNSYIISHNTSYIRPETFEIESFGISRRNGITAMINPENYYNIDLKDIKFYIEGKVFGMPIQLSDVINCSDYTGNIYEIR